MHALSEGRACLDRLGHRSSSGKFNTNRIINSLCFGSLSATSSANATMPLSASLGWPSARSNNSLRRRYSRNNNVPIRLLRLILEGVG